MTATFDTTRTTSPITTVLPNTRTTPLRVGLVSCCGPKLHRRAPARDLYTSDLFRKSLAYAEATCGKTYILSGYHGVVPLDLPLDPYDFALAAMTRSERRGWANSILEELAALLPPHEVTLVVLAGQIYATPLALELAASVEEHRELGMSAADLPELDWRVEQPLAGMEIGERKAWLKKELARLSRQHPRPPASS